MKEKMTPIREKLSRASFTVEAALLAPVLIVSVLMLFYLTIHVHNRTCLYAGAAEQAISGHEQEDPVLFALAEVTSGRTDTERERTVRYEAGTLHFSGEKLYEIKEEAAYRKYTPAKRIRQLAAAKRVVAGGD